VGAVGERLVRAVRRVDAHFRALGQHRLTVRGMATTLTVWIDLGDLAYLVQVGDSRCYGLRGRTVTRLSTDQTLAQRMVDQGVVDHVDETPPGWSNALTSAVGGHDLDPRVSRHRPAPDEVILLCSDGLNKHVSDDEIGSRLREATHAEDACRALVSRTLAEGGTDNVAVVVSRPPS